MCSSDLYKDRECGNLGELGEKVGLLHAQCMDMEGKLATTPEGLRGLEEITRDFEANARAKNPEWGHGETLFEGFRVPLQEQLDSRYDAVFDGGRAVEEGSGSPYASSCGSEAGDRMQILGMAALGCFGPGPAFAGLLSVDTAERLTAALDLLQERSKLLAAKVALKGLSWEETE